MGRLQSCSFIIDTTYAAISGINVSSITFLSRINSGLNQNLDMCANKLNVSLNTHVCFLLNPTAQGDLLICNNLNDTGFSLTLNVSNISCLSLSCLIFRVLIFIII